MVSILLLIGVRTSFKNTTAVNSVVLNNMNVTVFFGINHSVKNKLIALEVFYIIHTIDKLILENCLRINYVKKIIKSPKYFSFLMK